MKRFEIFSAALVAIFSIFLVFGGVVRAETPEGSAIVLNLDQATVKKGYTATSADGNLIIGLPPGSADDEVNLFIRRLGRDGLVSPNNKNLISDLYVFDFKYPKNESQRISFLKPFILVLKYDSFNESEKHIYFYNSSLNKWSPVLPDKIDAKNKFIRVKLNISYAQIAILEEKPLVGVASWYKYKNCLCAASPDYPKGSYLKVTSLENNKTVVVKVNDFGPDQSIFPDRVIDLDLTAFQEICTPRTGVVKVRVEKL